MRNEIMWPENDKYSNNFFPLCPSRHFIDPLKYITRRNRTVCSALQSTFNLLDPEFFFSFSTPVYKMLIIQEPNKIELWNKLHFEEEKTESIHHV
jgi:hypothetical protein